MIAIYTGIALVVTAILCVLSMNTQTRWPHVAVFVTLLGTGAFMILWQPPE